MWAFFEAMLRGLSGTRPRLEPEPLPPPPTPVPTLGGEVIAARARGAAGAKRCWYKVGSGGRNPEAPHPADAGRQLDCSGFVNWCCGIDRHQPSPVGWLSTDGILRDAEKRRAFYQFVAAPAVGDVVVYGDWVDSKGEHREGHCGIVSFVPEGWGSTSGWEKLRVIHCSSSNGDDHGNAIAETGAMGFARHGARFVRFAPLARL